MPDKLKFWELQFCKKKLRKFTLVKSFHEVGGKKLLQNFSWKIPPSKFVIRFWNDSSRPPTNGKKILKILLRVSPGNSVSNFPPKQKILRLFFSLRFFSVDIGQFFLSTSQDDIQPEVWKPKEALSELFIGPNTSLLSQDLWFGTKKVLKYFKILQEQVKMATWTSSYKTSLK